MNRQLSFIINCIIELIPAIDHLLMSEVDKLGFEISTAMLEAITSDYSTVNAPIGTIPLIEQKKFLMKYINSVDENDRRVICNILIMSGKKQLLQTCAEGTLIDLDNIHPTYIIGQMYELLKHKVDQMK